MLFRAICKIISRHVLHHLLIPLLGGLLFETVLYVVRHGCGVSASNNPVVSFLVPSLGVVVTYFVVMFFLLAKETSVGLHSIGSKKLEIALQGAESFLGIAAIDMREWFEPSSQVYLAMILKHKMAHENFKYNRVLLFSRSDFKNLHSQFLDYYFAKALIEQHNSHGVGLAYLKPEELIEVMDLLGGKEAKAIGLYPWWLPVRIVDKMPASWRILSHRKLALAVVSYPDKPRKFMRFTKDDVEIEVADLDSAANNSERAQAYQKLVEAIEKRALKENKIEAEHDFTGFY